MCRFKLVSLILASGFFGEIFLIDQGILDEEIPEERLGEDTSGKQIGCPSRQICFFCFETETKMLRIIM